MAGRRKTAWLVIAGLLAVGAAWALDPPRPTPPAATEEQAQEESPTAATAEPPPADGSKAAAPEDDETLPPLPPDARSTGPTPQRFDPSEEVRADFPVSFPIDI